MEYSVPPAYYEMGADSEDANMDEEKDKEKGLPLDFYGKSYLGRDVHVGVQGESPTASAAGATPTGALGVGPTGAGGKPVGATSAAPPTGATSPSGVTTALEALSLAQNVGKAGSEVGKSDSPDTTPSGLDFGPGTTLKTGTEAGKAALSAAPSTLDPTLSTAITTNPGLNVGDGLTAGGTAVETGAPVAEATSSGAGLGAGAAAAAAAAQEAAKLAGAKIPKPVTAGEAALNIGPSSLPTAIGTAIAGKPSVLDAAGLATGLSGLTSGIESFFGFGGKPPALAFPATTWGQLSTQVNTALPQPLTIPKGATPEQAKAIQGVNDAIAGIKGNYGSTDVPAWVLNAGPQSAETWTNILGQMSKDVQTEFADLAARWPTAMQAMQEATQASTPTKTKTPPQQVLPGGFYGSEKKLPTAGQP